jgi:hypothetical protein
MSTELGNIENAAMLIGGFVVTGHQWVALAFEEDEPYMITRFEGLKRELSAEEISYVNDTSDVYDYWVTPIENGFAVRFRIWDQIEVVFECSEVITTYRYYESVELERIFQNLTSASPELLESYIRKIERHGFKITTNGGKHHFNKV